MRYVPLFPLEVMQPASGGNTQSGQTVPAEGDPPQDTAVTQLEPVRAEDRALIYAQLGPSDANGNRTVSGPSAAPASPGATTAPAAPATEAPTRPLIDRAIDFTANLNEVFMAYQAGASQGALDSLNGVTDIGIGMANFVIQASPGVTAAQFVTGTSINIPAPQWSTGLVNRITVSTVGRSYVVDDPSTRWWSKFLGGEGLVTLGTLGWGQLSKVGSLSRVSYAGAPAIHPGRAAAEASVANRAGVLRALRSARTPEASAVAKLLKRGKVDVEFLPTDPAGTGAAGRAPWGSRTVQVYLDKTAGARAAAGVVAHEVKHVLQKITPSTYRLVHEFEAYQFQRRAGFLSMSDSQIWNFINRNPLYRGVPK